MRKAKAMLLARRGEGYVDTLIKMCIMLSLVLCFLAIAPIFPKKQTVDYMAKALARTIELTGEQGVAYEAELSRLMEQTGLTPEIVIEGAFDGSRLQLREQFSITVSHVESIRLVDPMLSPAFTLDIPVSKTVYGRSEVYWK